MKGAVKTASSAYKNYRKAGAFGAAAGVAAQLTSKAMEAARGMINPYVKDNKKKRRPKKRKPTKRSVAQSTKKLARQVKQLSKKVNNGQGVLHFISRPTGRCLASVNQQSLVTNGFGVSEIEGVLGNLRFFNPSAPDTLITGSGASGTYSRKYMFECYAKCLVRNNYQVPCKVTIYTVVPKNDTSILPTTAYIDGLVDVGNVSATSQLMYLSYSPQFNELWRITATKTFNLQPGQEVESMHSTGKFTYDPSLYDSHTLLYQQDNRAFHMMVRCDGPLAHDSSADQQGYSAAGVDIAWKYKMTVRYEAGVDLTFYAISDGADSFTNGALVSSYPIADNIGYSVN